MSGWLIWGSNTRKKEKDRISWSLLFLRMAWPFFSASKQVLVQMESIRTVRAESKNGGA